MLKMLRTINPDLIFNHRFGWRAMRMGEYDGPENHIGRFQTNRAWETCYCIGGPWGYSQKATPLSKRDVIGLLVRCAGNGGNLLLNTGPSPQGTIHDSHIQRYLDIGKWLKKYGESIYATRGGPYTSGPWGCSTRSKAGNFVYLHILGIWNGRLSLSDIGANVIETANLTGPGKVRVSRKGGCMVVSIDDFDASKQSAIDTIIRLKLDRKAMDLPIVKSVGESLTIGGSVQASSSGECARKKTKPEAVIATTAGEFHDGAYVRSIWRAASGDKTPWIEVDFKKSAVVEQVAIQEGRYGHSGTVQAFTVSLRSNGKWRKVYSGTNIGAVFGIVLDEPVKADAIRLDFQKFSRHVTLNAINAYAVDGRD
jgi:alpha-L-fucosidase